MPIQEFTNDKSPNQGRILINENFTDVDTRLAVLEAAGSLKYEGLWNASTNTPALATGGDSNFLAGSYFKVNVAGSTDLDGITDWNVGDWAIYNGTAWEKIDQSELVTSVNGQVGDVELDVYGPDSKPLLSVNDNHIGDYSPSDLSGGTTWNNGLLATGVTVGTNKIIYGLYAPHQPVGESYIAELWRVGDQTLVASSQPTILSDNGSMLLFDTPFELIAGVQYRIGFTPTGTANMKTAPSTLTWTGYTLTSPFYATSKGGGVFPSTSTSGWNSLAMAPLISASIAEKGVIGPLDPVDHRLPIYTTSERNLLTTANLPSNGTFQIWNSTENQLQVWSGAAWVGMGALLDEVDITTSQQTIAAAATYTWTESISYDRLYGVYVAISGLLAGQTAIVRLFGDTALTNEQYQANFTDIQFEDTAQAWRYRDRESSKTLRLQVENTSGADITVTVNVRAEPF